MRKIWNKNQMRSRWKLIKTVLTILILATVSGLGGIYAYGKLHMKSSGLPVSQQNKSGAGQDVSSAENMTSGQGTDSAEGVLPENTPPKDDGLSEATPAPSLTLTMVGDNLLHIPVSNSGRQPDGKYNYDHLFQHIKKDIKRADLSMINQEVILAGSQFGISGYPSFNGRYEVGNAIAKAGFRVVLHATNHSMDQGAAGVRSCVKRWEEKHPDVMVTGMYDSRKKQNKITFFKKNGIRVAILNYTYGTNGYSLPSDMPFAVNLLSRDRVREDVKKAKKKADFIVVCPHWGTEYYTGIDYMQKAWTKYFLSLGVNLVIGTHPHVIEPVQWKKDKKGHKMLVYYSLGNFMNSTVNRGPNTGKQFCSGMAKVTLQRQADGSVEIARAGFVPLITHWPKEGGEITTYKLSSYSKKLYEKSRVSDRDSKFTYGKVKRFFRESISEHFLENE